MFKLVDFAYFYAGGLSRSVARGPCLFKVFVLPLTIPGCEPLHFPSLIPRDQSDDLAKVGSCRFFLSRGFLKTTLVEMFVSCERKVFCTLKRINTVSILAQNAYFYKYDYA